MPQPDPTHGRETAHAPGETAEFDTSKMMDAVLRPLIAFDDRGRVRWLNDAAVEMCRRSREALLGRAYTEFIAESDVPRVRRMLVAQKRRRLRMSMERCALLRPDRSSIEIGFKSYLVPVRNGVAFLAAVDDLESFQNDLANLRLEVSRLNASVAEAEASAKLKGEFLATVSHELRTPMNGILGMSNLLLETELDRDQRGFAEIIVSSTKALLQLVDDVLDFSKVEAGKLELETLDFDLRLNVDQVAALLAPRADAKGVTLMCQINHEVPSLVRGDPSRLRQILLNLTGNALKFTDKGEVTIRVERLEETAAGVVLRFSVTDTGIGMTPEQMARLFQTYAQGDRSIARKFGGTGLGLAICKHLVGLMGGEIGVSSKAGDGSTFWFRLPLEKQFAVELATPSRDALRGLRVLVVDPARSVRESLIEMLKGWECEPAEAETSHAALVSLRTAAAAGKPVAVALLDMHMPGMEGEALGRAIRQEPSLAGIKLVLLTSLGRRGDAARARAAGFSAYLIKPVQQLHLHDALIEMVSGAQAAAPAGTAPLVTRHSIEENRRRRVRILLVEDDVINQLVALAALKRAGYSSDVAPNAADALDAAERSEYDLIFLDGHLPDMDGMEVAQRIRAREAGGRRTPIVAMTAMTAAGDRDRFLASGMDDYISKPIDLDVLARMVERWTNPEGATPVEAISDGTGNTMPAEVTTTAEAATTAEVTTTADAATTAEAATPAAARSGGAATTFAITAAADTPAATVRPLLPAPEGPVLDRAQLEESCMGHVELRRTLVQTFLADIRPRLTRLGTRVQAGDAQSVEFDAHGLKGMCGAIGATRCASMFRALEHAGRDRDLTHAPALMILASEEVARVEGELGTLLDAA